MRLPFVLLFISGCVSDATVEKISNKIPSIVITSHEDGSEFLEGVSSQFRAQATDDDDLGETLMVTWYVDDEVVCDSALAEADGSSFCDIAFGPEATRVIVNVSDPNNGGASDEISIVVTPTDAPAVSIIAPQNGSVFYSDQLIEFSALVSDNEDAPDTLTSEWTSSIDGTLVLDTAVDTSGTLQDFTNLSEGEHAIEIVVMDTTGKTSTDSVVVEVKGPNQLPSCSITEPLDGTTIVFGETIVFRAQVGDPDIEPNLLNAVWSSDKDGSIGQSSPDSTGLVTFAYDSLSVNTHTILLDVEDEVGARCTASILLSVSTPPTLILESPTDGDVFAVGQSITFRAAVTDAEDTPSSLSIEWETDRDGVISNTNPTSQGVSQFTRDNLSAGLHTLTTRLTDSDGLTADDIRSFRVDTPPTSPSVSISPNPAYTSDTLTGMATGSSDADGDPITYGYSWYQNGVLTNFNTVQVPASATNVNDVWTLRVTPNDGYLDGGYAEASIAIMSESPTVSLPAAISPDPAYTTNTVVCAASFIDPEDGPLPASYIWSINGQNIGTGATLTITSNNSDVGDSLFCLATATDSDGQSIDSTANIVISNTAPVLSIVNMTPNTNVTVLSTLSCSASESDIDDDVVLLSYNWYNGGQLIGSGQSITLSNSIAQNGDQIDCIVTATDAHGDSDTAQASVTIDNTPPTMPTVSILPNPATTNDDLVAMASGSIDPDGGAVTYSYLWFKNGVQTSYTSATVLSGATVGGDTWLVRVTPNDGVSSGPFAEGAVSINNTLPVVDSAILTPSAVATLDTLNINAVISDQDNGQPLSANYEWHVVDASNGYSDSVVQSGNATSLLGSVYFDRDDQVYVVVTPFDGTDDGSPLSSNTVTVDNSVPSTPGVSIGPATPYEGVDPLICSVISPASDIDNDSVQYLYEWFDAGLNLVQSTGPTSALSDTVSGSNTTGGIWTCEVTSFDGTDYGGGSSVTVDVDNGGPCSLAWDTGWASPNVAFLDNDFSVMSNASWEITRANQPRSSGKHYFEVEVFSDTNNFYMVGLVPSSYSPTSTCCLGSNGSYGYYIYNGSGGEFRPGGGNGGALCNNGAVSCTIGVAADLDSGQIWWSMDGVWQLNGGPNSSSGIFTNLTGTYYPSVNLAHQNFNNTKATLKACPGEQFYGPPAGYQGWE
ncbi:MAG: hypothetical protein ACON4U_03085 [Myxococcota bacterium]